MKKKFKSKIIGISLSFLLCLGLIISDTSNSYDYSSIFKEASIFNQNSSYTNNTNVSKNQKLDISEIKVIPLGTAFGIKLYSNGIVVTALQNIKLNNSTVCPAKDSGILPGDYILKVNDTKIENNEHFSSLISSYFKDKIVLTIKRENTIFTTEIVPVFDGDQYLLGLWVRDSAAGIGTLTFAFEDTGIFGGLGHAICDVDTNKLMEFKDGKATPITISSIEKAQNGDPGQICGYFSSNIPMGILYNNTETGIYGKLNNLPKAEEISVAENWEIQLGNATILTSIDNTGVKSYDINIENISPDKTSNTKNFVIKITDKELLSITGGIIQGMSGSPIIQNGKFIGAVTHVFVNDPTRGYGIFAENMLETALIEDN